MDRDGLVFTAEAELQGAACEEGSCEEGPCEEGPCEEGRREEGSCEEGSCEEGSCEEGPCEEGSCEEGPCEEGPCEEAPCEEGSCEEGSCEEGPCEEGPCEEGSREEGSCEEGPCEEGPCEEDRREEAMTERRFRVEGPYVLGECISLSTEVLHHVRVLRMHEGDTVTLFDGQGAEASATLEGASARITTLRLAEEERARVVLMFGLPRASVFDAALRDLTEVGVSEVRPFFADRSAAKDERDRTAHKMERWQRIVREASRQCERLREPEVFAPTSLREVLAQRPEASLLRMLDARTGDALITSIAPSSREVWLVVGPEGGLSEKEMATLREAGGEGARLHLPVMRAETAAVVITALVVEHLARHA